MENDINLSNTRKKIGLIAVVIFLIVTMISGATYAYLRWNSNNLFNIRIVTDIGDMGLTFDGGNMTINSLAPAPCTNGTYASKITTTIRRFNTSSYPGYVTFYLKLTSLTYNQGTLTSNDLSHIHFLLSTASNSCLNAVTDYYNNSISGTLDSAQIGSVGVAQSQTTTLSTWTYTLPARSGTNLSTGAITNTYYLYVWLDEDYTFTNYGSNGSQDPMEGLNFTLTWTSDGSIEQGTAPSQYVYAGYIPNGEFVNATSGYYVDKEYRQEQYLYDSYNEVVSLSGVNIFARYKVDKIPYSMWLYTTPASIDSFCGDDPELPNGGNPFTSQSACIDWYSNNAYNYGFSGCAGFGDEECPSAIQDMQDHNLNCRNVATNSWCLERNNPSSNSYYESNVWFTSESDCNDELLGVYGYNTLDEATAAGYTCYNHSGFEYDILDEDIGYVLNGNVYYLVGDVTTDAATVVNSFGTGNCSDYSSTVAICSSSGLTIDIPGWPEYTIYDGDNHLYWIPGNDMNPYYYGG